MISTKTTHMKWTKKSIYSGIVRTKDLPITQDQIDRYESGVDIGVCMPHLDKWDRLFFISGLAEEDFDEDSTVNIDDKGDL